MKHQRGFTALELMVTIGVIALMSALSLPNIMSWRENLKFKSSYNEFLSAVQASRMKAVRDNALVVLDVDPMQYIIFIDNGQGGGVAGNWNHEGDEIILKREQLPEGVRIVRCTFEGGLIGFNSFGAPMLPLGFPAQNEEIYLINQLNTHKGIRITLAGTPLLINSHDGYYWN
jgi:type IV fimbrial biogenesis protein FimT